MLHDDDDNRKPQKSSYIIGSDLEDHSIEALQGMIAALRGEIERLEAAIARKGKDRSAAEDLFRR